MFSSGLLCRSPLRYEGKCLFKKFVKLTVADFCHLFLVGWGGKGNFRIFEYILVVYDNISVQASAEC